MALVMLDSLATEIPVDSAALQRVERAIAELRRGGFVAVAGPGPGAILVQAAEMASESALARLAALANSAPRLVLTARRSASLGLKGDVEAETSGVIALALGGAGAKMAITLADPTNSSHVVFTEQPKQAAVPDFAAAAVELTKLARLLPATVAAPLVVNQGGAVIQGRAKNLDRDSLISWALDQEVPLAYADEITGYRTARARTLTLAAEARVPLAGAEDTRVLAFRPSDGGVEHLALIIGEPRSDGPVLTRLHSECFTGDLLGSLRCDCGDQLRGAIAAIAEAGSGILLYLSQEGRGIGLVNKLRAYELQDRGADTAEANEQLGFDADERIYLPAAEMLRQLGFNRVRLLTNNPEKMAALSHCGIAVEERVPHAFPSNGHNDFYLATKAARFGHLF